MCDRMVELCFVKICFCHEWRNLLYLRDKKENRTLFFPYKNHNYQQEAEKSCICIKKANVHDTTSALSQQPNIFKSEDLVSLKKSLYLLTPLPSMDLFQVLVQTPCNSVNFLHTQYFLARE
uniref:Uncharacterized protein n=1 Tax=Accipiter nisus TaxID=211598 RepID=A0A8B9NLZ0_9AVES